MSDPDNKGFMQKLGGIKPLRQDKIDPQAEKPRPAARLRPRQSYATKPAPACSPERNGVGASASWFHHGLQKKRIRAIRAGQVAVDLSCDLHGLNRDQALFELEAILAAAGKQQLRLILIIHGKGYNSAQEAVIKPLVQHWLSNQNTVLGWCPAIPRHGGTGATYVYLRRASS
jgi:DNA-nicking Smr family endonuclease